MSLPPKEERHRRAPPVRENAHALVREYENIVGSVQDMIGWLTRAIHGLSNRDEGRVVVNIHIHELMHWLGRGGRVIGDVVFVFKLRDLEERAARGEHQDRGDDEDEDQEMDDPDDWQELEDLLFRLANDDALELPPEDSFEIRAVIRGLRAAERSATALRDFHYANSGRFTVNKPRMLSYQKIDAMEEDARSRRAQARMREDVYDGGAPVARR